jgi:hypothetical protein
MKASDTPPAPRALQRILRETTERLAAECAHPGLSAPRWDEAHWRVAQAAAAMHGVSPLLARRLRWSGTASWQAFLERQRQHTFDRHLNLVALLERLDALARESGLGIVALKGVALHAIALYAPGERPMADIDLLVRERDLPGTVALLERIGYLECSHSRRERTFAQPAGAAPARLGEHARNPLKIELHTRIAEPLPVYAVDITELLLPPRGEVGIGGYRTAATLMTHLLLHAAGNMRTRSLRLMQLHDIAALSGRLDESQWSQVLTYERLFGARWAYPPLALTQRYYGHAIPDAVLERAAESCTPALRRAIARQRLSDLSLSYPWIEFCPGIEWCVSMGERLRYAHMRVFPGPEMRAEIKSCESAQTWAQGSPWFQLPRAQRMVRWVLTRPARVATMSSVREAWRTAERPEAVA